MWRIVDFNVLCEIYGKWINLYISIDPPLLFFKFFPEEACRREYGDVFLDCHGIILISYHFLPYQFSSVLGGIDVTP